MSFCLKNIKATWGDSEPSVLYLKQRSHPIVFTRQISEALRWDAAKSVETEIEILRRTITNAGEFSVVESALSANVKKAVTVTAKPAKVSPASVTELW